MSLWIYSASPMSRMAQKVRGIPVAAGISFSESVESFFMEYHSSTYLSHSVVRQTSKLRGLINDAEHMSRRLIRLKSRPKNQQKNLRNGFLGIFGQNVNIVDHYEKKFEDLQANVRIEQSDVSSLGEFKVQPHVPAHVVAHAGTHPHQGSISSQIEIFFEPKNIPSTLAIAVPAQASFFIAYVVTSGWTSLSSELTRTMSLIGDFIKRHCLRCMNSEFHAPSIPYHSDIPKILFFQLLGITYFILAPLILPFLLVYFSLGYIIYRNQLLNVYVPKFETGGKFWPIVHNSTIFSLILMHAIAIGIFGLKKLPLASSLIVPLPVLTLLFNEYCRKRFLPIFKAYSAEALIKKDRENQNDPTMPEFYNRLVTAYRDPALMPIEYSSNSDERTSPLLSSARV
ncbi:hypothetical protein QJS04_geneDACA007914 [Acorus gramineus]|uniref:CSC1-like protein HYP1 n=1 Tax=Acorus gramineus TaxID=55184 RepID=A0AAV9BAT8_ACOGR|nr:hypothetical protein QJS04_geneDACA007914 [Acorus gramineus]